MCTDLFTPERLQQIPFFSSVSLPSLGQLLETMNKLDIPANTMLFNEGDPGNSFIVIIEGELEIIKSIGTPEEQLLEVSGAGDFLGEMSLFHEGALRSAGARTRTEICALEMTRENFGTLLHSDPELAIQVARVSAERVRKSNDFLQERNEELEKALQELRAAQAELIVKERMERELEVARTIQQDILPHNMPAVEGYDFGARMIPAREVGGDFFDFIPIGEHRTAVVIGDVSDKGVPAAIFMALTRSLVHAEARRSSDPEEVMRQVNKLSLEMSEAAMFVTVLYGILDCRNHFFEYARAGHELPLFITIDGEEVEIPHDRGQPLSLFEDAVFDKRRLELAPGTFLLMYTDGVTDATDPDGKFFGLDRLRQCVLEDPRNSGQETCDRIVDAVKDHKGDSMQYDDVTVVAIHAHRNRGG